MAQVVPQVDGSIYSLTFKNIEFKVDASRGAKISSLALSGNEFLVSEAESSGFLWGSALWTAPQNEWGWPPPFMELEDGDYTGSITDNKIILESVEELDMQFVKTFWANESDTSISIKYTLKNVGDASYTKALWELTRPPVNGLTFWPTGPGGTWGDLASSVVENGNYSWLDIDAEPRSGLKFFADGAEGWFVHVDADRRLFVKVFEDVDQADFASEEGELELWIADDYIELENIGALQTLAAGESFDYDVKWYFRELPESMSVEVGSNELISYVNTMLSSGGTNVSPEIMNTHQVYPNPANNQITIKWGDSDQHSAYLRIYNVIGDEVLSKRIKQNQSISISNLPNGVYMYTVQTTKALFKGKLVKN